MTHPPGSEAALEAGCTCPAVENHNGKGAWGSDGKYYIISVGCLHHGRGYAPEPRASRVKPTSAHHEEVSRRLRKAGIRLP